MILIKGIIKNTNFSMQVYTMQFNNIKCSYKCVFLIFILACQKRPNYNLMKCSQDYFIQQIRLGQSFFFKYLQNYEFIYFIFNYKHRMIQCIPF